MQLRIESIGFRNCTTGKLYIDDVFFCYTMENPWLGNKVGISCIPKGDYSLRGYQSSRFGESYILKGDEVGHFDGEKQRSGILFHRGNGPRDTRGCILLGYGTGIVNSEWAVTNSTQAVKDFLNKLDGYDHKLRINRL